MRRLNKLPFLCLLTLCLLASQVTLFGYVWCLSDDGHVSLEAAVDNVCVMDYPATFPADIPAPSLTVGVDDCGPCFDVSPSHQWGPPSVYQIDILDSFLDEFAPITVASHSPRPDRVLNNHSIADAIPRAPDSILHQRTIILRI